MRGLWLLLAVAPLVEAASPYRATVREEHYQVYGSTIAEIQRSIIARTPLRDGRDTFAGDTSTRYQANYRLEPVPPDGCVLRDVEVLAESRVTLPSLAPGELSPAVAAEWSRYYRALRNHEYLHVEIARQAVRSTQEWLASMRLEGDCAAARPRVRRAIEAYIRNLSERDRQLDAQTEHGRTQGAWLDERVR